MAFSDLLLTADRAALAVLGDPVTYTPGVGSAANVRGVFDAAYQRVDVGHAGVASVGPAVFLRVSDLPSDPSDDADATVTVRGTTYTVHEAQPDGLGGVRLLLHEG
jgi:hypothetical protein